MSDPRRFSTPIRLLLDNANPADPADPLLLGEQLAAIAGPIEDAVRERTAVSTGAASAPALIAVAGNFLPLMQSLDAQYGADAELPLQDAAGTVNAALQSLAELDRWLDRLELSTIRTTLYSLQLGIGVWAMRHRLTIQAPAILVNALAVRANHAATRQDTAAVYALMQGFIEHLAPALDADLERSDPERPWRLLNLNFAITAIRTGDVSMMRFAFETLNRHLPDERAGFYDEALALASQPGFPPETRAMIEAECTRWSAVH